MHTESMHVRSTSLPGVLILDPVIHGDARGFFVETWNRERYAEAGIRHDFVQDNLSRSRRGVLRGLHFQHPGSQGKIVSVIEGEVWDVAVDLRRGSPHFGEHMAVSLDGERRRQLWIPPGFAHGFCVLSEQALFHYKCTAPYRPDWERGVRWDDPELAIPWPLEGPTVSERDGNLPCLAELAEEALPPYGVGS